MARQTISLFMWGYQPHFRPPAANGPVSTDEFAESVTLRSSRSSCACGDTARSDVNC